MVFQQTDDMLMTLQNQGASIVSFGCDGGVHGMEVTDSMHRTTGQQLKIIKSRTAESLTGTLLSKFGIQLIINKTWNDKVIAAPLDPSHIYKRQEEAWATGTRVLVQGPLHMATFGFMAQSGVRSDIVVKPDAMSDETAASTRPANPMVAGSILSAAPVSAPLNRTLMRTLPSEAGIMFVKTRTVARMFLGPKGVICEYGLHVHALCTLHMHMTCNMHMHMTCRRWRLI